MKLGQDVELAESGAIAIDKASRTRFDIVLMDLNMPGMNGRECVGFLRHGGKSSGARIVAVTANLGSAMSDTGSAANLTDCGFETVLLKPFSLMDLRSILVSKGSSYPESDESKTADADIATQVEHATNLV
ncbi:MAG: response regulator, partial [Pseudomonadales bacterium]